MNLKKETRNSIQEKKIFVLIIHIYYLDLCLQTYRKVNLPFVIGNIGEKKEFTLITNFESKLEQLFDNLNVIIV